MSKPSKKTAQANVDAAAHAMMTQRFGSFRRARAQAHFDRVVAAYCSRFGHTRNAADGDRTYCTMCGTYTSVVEVA